MANKKLFFFDIDGTLLVGEPGSQYLPDTTRYTLDQLREKGHFVAIATGRSAPMAMPVLRNLGLNNMVCDGGHGIVLNDVQIECRPLDREKCLALIEECDTRGIAWAFSPNNSADRFTPDERFQNETRDVYMRSTVIPGLDPKRYDAVYKMYIACPRGLEYTLDTLKDLPWCRYGDTYFFVEPIDKSEGIHRMLELIDGLPSDVVVFGDALNDLSMFRDEWTSIAMGNAVDELKARADYVTADVDKDGIYLACLKYGWIEPISK